MSLLNVFSQPFQFLSLPPPGSFANQTVLITGANTGLGFATAQSMLDLGASKVILGVRSIAKGEAAKARLEAATTNVDAEIEVWEIDMASFESVKAFAARAAKLEKLDTAVLNAGMASLKWAQSQEGWEMQIQVNVLSTALLGLLLLPTLVETQSAYPKLRPHLVVVGSDVHRGAALEERKSENVLRALNDKARWEKAMQANPGERYSASKLLATYVALELAQATPLIGTEPAVIVDVVAPGFCKSELMSRETGAPFILVAVQAIAGRSPEQGSRTIVDAATRGVEDHGKYFDNQKVASLGDLVTSKEGLEVRAKVWEEILEVLGKVAPEIRSIASGTS